MKYSLWINGEWKESQGGGKSEIDNPATGETIAHVVDGSNEDVDRAVQAAANVHLYKCQVVRTTLPHIDSVVSDDGLGVDHHLALRAYAPRQLVEDVIGVPPGLALDLHSTSNLSQGTPSSASALCHTP